MKFSFIVPAHNEESTIEECLNSILKQTYKNFEVIVINDGSTDRTEEIVKKLQKKSKKIKLVSFKKGHSAAFARNRGAEKAIGEILVFIDADQFVKKNFLRIVNNDFKNKEVLVISGIPVGYGKTFIAKCYSARKKLFWIARQKKKRFVGPEALGGGTTAIKKSFFYSLGKFDEKLFYYEDRKFDMRVKRISRILVDPRLKVYHHDPENFSELIRQSKWVGKGIATNFKKFKEFGSILVISFWPIFFLLLILSFLIPSLIYTIVVLLFIPSIQLIRMFYYSKDFFHSFGFILLSIIKHFISFCSFVKNVIKL